jgi:hypothetical protein
MTAKAGKYKSQPGCGWLLLRKGEKEIVYLPFFLCTRHAKKEK